MAEDKLPTRLAATVILTAGAALACYLPMRRAIRIDAVALLRTD